MKRVLVIGSCGAGKSTFARQLHEMTGLPLIPLDRHYWKPGWVESEKDVWHETVRELIGRDEWIIDGNYGGTMEMRLKRADTVIWLDLPRHICLYRVLKRTYSYSGRRRPDMAEGCAERIELPFLKYVWNFRRDKNPLLEKRLAEVAGKITKVRLTSTRAVSDFFLDKSSRMNKMVNV